MYTCYIICRDMNIASAWSCFRMSTTFLATFSLYMSLFMQHTRAWMQEILVGSKCVEPTTWEESCQLINISCRNVATNSDISEVFR